MIVTSTDLPRAASLLSFQPQSGTWEERAEYAQRAGEALAAGHEIEAATGVLSILGDDSNWRVRHEVAQQMLWVPEDRLFALSGRLTGDASWRPDAVSLAHAAPANFSGHVDYFGVTPTFCAHHNEIRFDASVLHQEVGDADRSSLPAVDGELHEIVRSDSEEESWISTLRVQVASRLCDGYPRLSDVAPDLGLSTRSLQRRLGARGLSYRDLVQDARHSLAMRYLEESETDLTEIAFLLGYADLSAFSRAFHRWTATSPGALRRRRRVGERSGSRQRIAAGPRD